MSRHEDKIFGSTEDDTPHTEYSGHAVMPDKTVSTVSSFIAHSGEFVIQITYGTIIRDRKILTQMIAKEVMAWDRHFSEFLSGAYLFDSLLNRYKLIEQANQASHRSGRALIVLCNYELIDSESDKEVVIDLITACGDAFTFILVSRHDITVGARCAAKLRRPAQPHYQLSREEVKAYYTTLDIVLSHEILDHIMEITQGEPVVVSRLGECLKRSKPLHNADVDSAVENLYSVFMLEYFQPYPKELRQFQVLLSLLDDFTTELIHELRILSIEDAQQLLRDHVFIHHNLEDGAYHIQGLYRSFLREQLPQLPKKLRFGFLRKAAQWHDDQGDYLRAIRYYAQCSDYHKMIGPLKRLPALHIDRDSSEILLGILDKIPQADKDSYVEFELARCLSLFNIAREAEALQGLLGLAEKLEQKDRTSNEDAVLGNTYLTLAIWAWFCGSRDYLPYIMKASEHLDGVSHLYGLQRFSVFGGALRFKEMRCGDLMAMKEAALQAIPYVRKILPAECGTAYLAAAEAHLSLMEFDAAGLYAGKAIAESKAFGQWGTLCETYYLLQRMSMASGSLDDMISFRDQIYDLCHTQSINDKILINRVSQAHFFLYMGLYNKMAPFMKQGHRAPSAYMRTGELGRELYIHAQYLFHAQRQNYPAIFFIDQSMPVCYENGLWNYWLRLIILKAVIYSTLGRSTVAVRFFREAYHLSKPNDIMFLFVEFGELIVELLEGTEEFPPDIDPLWIENLKEKAGRYEKNKKLARDTYLNRHPEYAVKKLDKLSGREFLALKHLCNGLSNEEIAEQMKIQGSSVYRYLSMAYKKIGAKGHNDAVRIAVLEGIMDMSSD